MKSEPSPDRIFADAIPLNQALTGFGRDREFSALRRAEAALEHALRAPATASYGSERSDNIDQLRERLEQVRERQEEYLRSRLVRRELIGVGIRRGGECKDREVIPAEFWEFCEMNAEACSIRSGGSTFDNVYLALHRPEVHDDEIEKKGPGRPKLRKPIREAVLYANEKVFDFLQLPGTIRAEYVREFLKNEFGFRGKLPSDETIRREIKDMLEEGALKN